ncbi:MBL fold metallo-hydrolase [Paucibacter sp. B2R-40]|uniref:MBL fold metallo-hydrolase RNA specificity domain-containing protein n=1 Tax=Paucibacter sp. B2R-40 TaxID=2893554 RepID=UPI0021E3911B|nr:MBL fold metallo-hydrolase [Paucibacter sp. B2R-40]MCV2356250.1 MBL fold metallo-hydrolase [Paucibacter sp. B2R-40]
MKLSFLGAADCVTGSRHLLDLGGQRLLLDCGLFQGFKQLRERNWAGLGVAAASIDAVLLSHAHLDHSGYIPALRGQGFKGQVFSTGATRDLCEVLLLDSAHLQEEDARRANRQGTSKHAKALPLYTVNDTKKALTHFVGLPRDGRLKLGSGADQAEIRFTPVGHLLGACAISVSAQGKTLVYSGDVGRHNDLLMPAPQRVEEADILLIESTYGNRLHPAEDVQARLAQILRSTFKRGGTVLLPSFAVGRAQALLLVLQRLRETGELAQDVPIYLDSPMALQATELTIKHKKLLRIGASDAAGLFDGVKLVTKGADSLKLASQLASARARPAIVISASGMATGGRVLNYIETLAPQARHHIAFPGFQVSGSRGAKMVEGDREIKLHGKYIAVNAEISHLEGFSGHADADGLMAWMRGFKKAPSQVFVVHGEPAASDALRSRIQDELGWPVRVPQHGETVAL